MPIIKRDLRHNSFSNSSNPSSTSNNSNQNNNNNNSNMRNRLAEDISISRPDSNETSPIMSYVNNINSDDSSVDGVGVDELVTNLTHKLCLKSKSLHLVCKQNRMSPYQLHNNSGVHRSSHPVNPCYCLNCKYFNSANNINKQNKSASMNDPYDLMQELLKEGSLIKEAVKRLQFGKTKKKLDFYSDDYSDEEVGTDENVINLLNS